MKRLLILLTLIPLGGCPGPLPKIVTQTVEVPVRQPCKVDVPKRPEWPDTVDALMQAQGAGIDASVALLMQGRNMRDPYILQLETALNGCTH